MLAVTSTALAGLGSTACAQDEITLDRDELVERGEYLVTTIAGCGNCHTPHNDDGTLNQDMRLAGAYVITEPEFEAYAKNITPDMETGIGSWSEDEIVDALRNGVRPDGEILGPPMSFPFYKQLSDNDAYAIAAYLKTVEPIRNEVPDSTYEIPLDWGPPAENVPPVSREDPVEYGEYLAGPVGHCTDCHTTYVQGQPDFDQVGRGQNVFPNMFGRWTVISANITPHEQGIGNWTDEEIKRAITEGVSRDGRELAPAMPYELYDDIREEDLDALVAYLRSLEPLPTVQGPGGGEEE